MNFDKIFQNKLLRLRDITNFAEINFRGSLISKNFAEETRTKLAKKKTPKFLPAKISSLEVYETWSCIARKAVSM